MKICLLYSGKDSPAPVKRGFLCGLLSYIARENTLYTSKNLPFETADILAVSADMISDETVRAICKEARQRNAHGVLIDTNFPFSSEAFGSLAVFAPQRSNLPSGIIPIVETSLSGGSLSEHIAKSNSPLSVSIRRTAQEFSLPASNASGTVLSNIELRRLISRYSPDVFFSPELYRKYFMYEPERGLVRFVLFDDAETISHKLRLAKKHGASHAFLVWDEICDIFDEIFF